MAATMTEFGHGISRHQLKGPKGSWILNGCISKWGLCYQHEALELCYHVVISNSLHDISMKSKNGELDCGRSSWAYTQSYGVNLARSIFLRGAADTNRKAMIPSQFLGALVPWGFVTFRNSTSCPGRNGKKEHKEKQLFLMPHLYHRLHGSSKYLQ